MTTAGAGEVVGEIGEALDGAKTGTDGGRFEEVEGVLRGKGELGHEGLDVEIDGDKGREELELAWGEGDGRGGDHVRIVYG